jgi:hypothetical protein
MSDAFQGFQTLDPEVTRKMVEGLESALLPAAGKTQELLDEIGERECDICQARLVPRLPSDPTKAFRKLLIQYGAWCPYCREFR